MGTGSFECNGMGINFAFWVPSLSVYEFTYECGTHRKMYNSNGEYQEAFNGWIKVQASYSPGSKRATETARWVVGGQVRAKIDWEGSCPNDPWLVANVNCETSSLKDDMFDPNSHKQYDLELSNYYSSSMFYDWWKDTGQSAYPVTAQMSVQQRAALIKKNHISSTKPPLALAPPSRVILSPADGAIFLRWPPGRHPCPYGACVPR